MKYSCDAWGEDSSEDKVFDAADSKQFYGVEHNGHGPEESRVDYKVDEMKTAVDKGALLEHDWIICTPQAKNPTPPSKIADVIKEIGANSVFWLLTEVKR